MPKEVDTRPTSPPHESSGQDWRSYTSPGALFLLAIAAGFFLRLNMLSSQILLDDEWHGVLKVTGQTLLAVLKNLNPADNATVPFSLYYWSLYRWLHWSEWTLRGPSILAGLASLVLLPWLIRRVLGSRVASVFAIFLAIAPVLVFYGRFARAYSLTALLSFTVLLLSHLWLTTARTRYLVSSVLLGTLATYVHPTSLVAVFSPLLLAFGLMLAARIGLAASASQQIVVTRKAVLLVGILDSVLLLPLVLSVFLDGSTVPWAATTPTVDGVLTALTIISGTANVPLNLLFFTLCAAGHVLLLRAHPLLGSLFLSVIGAYAVALTASRPQGINSGLVLVRYMIVVVPIALTGVALAIERMTSKLGLRVRVDDSVACAAGGVVLAGCFYFAGPLPDLQRAPNNFMGHSAFQGSYQRVRWDRSDAHHPYAAAWRREDQISPFYHQLRDRADVDAIVEYPFDVCDFNDLYYYYQHFHGKRVLVGYCSDPRRIGVPVVGQDDVQTGPNLRMLAADRILSRLPADGRIAFRNMVDVTRYDALLASGADILVLHKVAPVVADTAEGATKTVPVHFTSIDDLSVEFRERFGSPVYEDAELVCFRIKR